MNNKTTDSNLSTISALPHIAKIKSYAAGKPIEDLAREKNLSKIIKLASNENPFGPSPKVIENIINKITNINLYPDPEQYELKSALAKFYNINNNMLAIGNGSDELIQLITRAFVSKSNNIIAPQYSFISYSINCATVGAEYLTADINSNWQNNLDNVLKLINANTKLICIANPNNPTGTYLDNNTIINFLDNIPENILVLLDEAYFEYIKYNSNNNFTTDLSINLTQKYSNLIITRTFSKAYGLAGLRAGYCIAHPDIINNINKLKLPFNTNKIVQYAATIALQDQEYIKKIIDINNQQRNLLYKNFSKLNLEYIPSETNFITIGLCHYNNITANELYNKLLDHGIITRPINNYGLDNFLRISIGNPEENNFLITTLKNIFK